MFLTADELKQAARRREQRIRLDEQGYYQDRLDLLNVSLKLGAHGVYVGYQRLTEARFRQRGFGTPTIDPGRPSYRPWGSWNERDGRKMSSFSRFENMEANIRDKMDL